MVIFIDQKSYKVKPKFVAIVPYNKMPDTDELR